MMEHERLMSKTIVVLHGDQTGEEPLQQALRVLDAGVIGVVLTVRHFDLSPPIQQKGPSNPEDSTVVHTRGHFGRTEDAPMPLRPFCVAMQAERPTYGEGDHASASYN